MPANLSLYNLSNSNLVPKKRMFPVKQFMDIVNERDAYAADTENTNLLRNETALTATSFAEDEEVLNTIRRQTAESIAIQSSDPSEMWKKTQEARVAAMRERRAYGALQKKVSDFQEDMAAVKTKLPDGWNEDDANMFESYVRAKQEPAKILPNGEVYAAYRKVAPTAKPEFDKLVDEWMAKVNVSKTDRGWVYRGDDGIERAGMKAGEVLSEKKVREIIEAGKLANNTYKNWRNYKRDAAATLYGNTTYEELLQRMPQLAQRGEQTVKDKKSKVTKQVIPSYIETAIAERLSPAAVLNKLEAEHDDAVMVNYGLSKYPYSAQKSESVYRAPTLSEQAARDGAFSPDTDLPGTQIVVPQQNFTGFDMSKGSGEIRKTASESRNQAYANLQKALQLPEGDAKRQAVQNAQLALAGATAAVTRVSAAQEAKLRTTLVNSIPSIGEQVFNAYGKLTNPQKYGAPTHADRVLIAQNGSKIAKALGITERLEPWEAFKAGSPGSAFDMSSTYNNKDPFAVKVSNLVGGIQQYVDRQKISIASNPVGMMMDHKNKVWNDTFMQIIKTTKDQNLAYDLSKPTTRSATGYERFEDWENYEPTSTILVPVANGTWQLHTTIEGKNKEPRVIAIDLNMAGNNIISQMGNRQRDLWLKYKDTNPAAAQQYYASWATITGQGNGAEFQDMYIGDRKPISPVTNPWAAQEGYQLELAQDGIDNSFKYWLRDKAGKLVYGTPDADGTPRYQSYTDVVDMVAKMNEFQTLKYNEQQAKKKGK